jgi:hypothetical protein
VAAQKAGEAIWAAEDAGAPPEKIYVRDHSLCGCPDATRSAQCWEITCRDFWELTTPVATKSVGEMFPAELNAWLSSLVVCRELAAPPPSGHPVGS